MNAPKKYTVGYKKCKENLLVTLYIPHNAKTNENRKVFDKNFAKYRCSRAYVYKIENIFDKKLYDQAASYFYDHFIYKIGDYVKSEQDYNNTNDVICTSGIHYFKTQMAAYFYKFVVSDIYSGDVNVYYENFISSFL